MKESKFQMRPRQSLAAALTNPRPVTRSVHYLRVEHGREDNYHHRFDTVLTSPKTSPCSRCSLNSPSTDTASTWLTHRHSSRLITLSWHSTWFAIWTLLTFWLALLRARESPALYLLSKHNYKPVYSYWITLEPLYYYLALTSIYIIFIDSLPLVIHL